MWTCVLPRIVVWVSLGCTRDALLPCVVSSQLCRPVVVPGATELLFSVVLMRLRVLLVMIVQLMVRLPPAWMIPWRWACRRPSSRIGVWTSSLSGLLTRSEGGWDTFLPFFELVASFLQMSALGAASTDMLLSLPILLLESSSESLACWRLVVVLACTRCTFPTDRCDLTNLILLPFPSLSEDLSGGVVGFDVYPCSCMKCAFLSSAEAKVLPQFFS